MGDACRHHQIYIYIYITLLNYIVLHNFSSQGTMCFRNTTSLIGCHVPQESDLNGEVKKNILNKFIPIENYDK